LSLALSSRCTELVAVCAELLLTCSVLVLGVGEEAEVGAAEDGTTINGAINTSTSAIFQHKELALSTSLPRRRLEQGRLK
jgi:hypothetical protein